MFKMTRSQRYFLSIFFVSAAAIYLGAQAGPYQRQTIDPAAADRGKKLYAQYCINCHGPLAKGTENGPDLIRSVVVLRDRLGSEIGPAMKKLPNHKSDLASAEVVDLSHFLKQH